MHPERLDALLFIALCADFTAASAHIGAYSQARPDFFTGFVHALSGVARLA